MSTQRLTLMLASLCALMCGLMLSGAPAQATVTHNYLSQLPEIPAKGPKGEAVPLPGPLKDPASMAVNSGELYVAEFRGAVALGEPDYRLERFNASTGAFVSQFPTVPSLIDLFQGVAVDHATGDVYVGGEVAGKNGKGAVAVFSSAGSLLNVWDGSDTPSFEGGNPEYGTKTFDCFTCSAPTSIAVDNSASLSDWAQGDVYVVVPDQRLVDVFQPEAGGGEKYVTQIKGISPAEPFTGFPGAIAIAPNGDVLIAVAGGGGGGVGSHGVDIFKPTVLGEYEFVRELTGTPSGPFPNSTISSIAVDGGSGDIYVTEPLFASQAAVDEFSGEGVYLGHLTGTPSGPFGPGENDFLAGVAVDPESHHVYVGERQPEAAFIDVFGPNIVIPDVITGSFANLTPTRVHLKGTVNPDEAGKATCKFEWGTSTALGSTVPCAATVPNGNSPVEVEAELAGLQPDTTYYYRLQASNEQGVNPGEASQDQQFTTPGPGTREESAAEVGSTSVTLEARIDPDGVPTSYYFQYGTSSGYGTDVPALSESAPHGLAIGSSPGYQQIGVHLQGLQAGTIYHYRVVVVSEPAPGEYETFDGPDATVSTQALGGPSSLPDGRAWELVTPPNKHGAALVAYAEFGNGGGSLVQAAADGGALTYVASAPLVVDPAGTRVPEQEQIISNRLAPGDWGTQDIATPHSEGAAAFAIGHSAEYKLFSADLSLGLVEPVGHTPLPPLPASAEKTIYLRAANGEYKALVTSANVPPGTAFGGNGESGNAFTFVTATPDFSHVILESQVDLTSTQKAEGQGGLYEWSGGHLELVSQLPGNTPVSKSNVGYRQGNVVRHALSDDGSRLVWGHEVALYLRDTTRQETIQIDAPAPGAPPRSSTPSRYMTANGEDSRVFFTSSDRVTADSTARPSGDEADLYEFEVTSGAGEPLAGKLTDLSVDSNVGGSADVQNVIGASEDGSYVYFLANGVLGDGVERGARAGDCERTRERATQTCNLYVEHYDQEAKAWSAPTFIATLSGEDGPSWGAANASLQAMTSRVSPNGRYLAFMSERSLTGYENHDANSGAPDEEVFLYDVSTGRLVCASCNPTGARPVGALVTQEVREQNWRKRWLAASVPGWDAETSGTAVYQPRYLSNGGRLFFDSADALVPGDVNGKEDVYEYEPAGAGSCQAPTYGQSASDVFSEGADGCVALISSGASPEDSKFMDASETGGDVFFLTLSRLSPQDYDTAVDMYDAHECTPLSPCAPAPALAPPACTTGDACKPAPTPQPAIFGAPASATFSGAGNIVPQASPPGTESQHSSAQARKLAQALRACGKKPKRRRAGCRAQAKRRYGAKSSRARRNPSAATGR